MGAYSTIYCNEYEMNSSYFFESSIKMFKLKLKIEGIVKSK